MCAANWKDRRRPASELSVLGQERDTSLDKTKKTQQDEIRRSKTNKLLREEREKGKKRERKVDDGSSSPRPAKRWKAGIDDDPLIACDPIGS